jgi:hypothetical protein
MSGLTPLTRIRNHLLLLSALSILLAATAASGDVIEFTDASKWQDAVGEFTTIDFTQHPAGTIITDQYEDLGILFTDGNDVILDSSVFLNDGFGLWGPAFDDVTVEFETVQRWIAVDFPGAVVIQLYCDGELLFESRLFGGSGEGFFGGLISSEPFDAAFIFDPTLDGVAIDDLHFGPPIPAPPAGAVILMSIILAGRRRRRELP